ncbi:hypothetical protein STVIR_6184 [Streptomyces viridochromogenes Tue57]|uniref:Uncharacterized protein n=1 Tax=Streptomyces viridochromogenes Tue57 TaxID=1160705 RepID=L8P5L1_STRVR|nr:hypothetical protein STVIR_6184 [Streptomyces viridochromogenes Tue57]
MAAAKGRLELRSLVEPSTTSVGLPKETVGSPLKWIQ